MDESSKKVFPNSSSSNFSIPSEIHGEMASLISNYNWDQTSLGPVSRWSPTLISSVNFVLSSSIPFAIFWGKDLIFIYNDSWRNFLGDKHPQSFGQTASEVFPEIWDQIGPQFERVMSGEGPIGVEDQELLLNRNNGFEKAWFDYHLSPIYLSEGSIGGLLITATEKTLQNQMGLEYSRLLFERTAVLDNLMEALTLVDLSGKVFYQNKAALRLHGYESLEDEDLPKYLYSDGWELFDLDGVPVAMDHWPITKAIKGESFRRYELQVTRPEKGISFIGSYSSDLIKDDDGDPLFAMVVTRDVTQQREAEKQLKNEQKLLQVIFDNIPIMLTLYDPEIEKFSMNKHFTDLTGWTMDDVQEKNIMELAYPDPAYRERVSNYMQSLSPGFMDIEMTLKDGRILETSWANIKIPDGRQVGIGIDISARIKAERALKQYSDRLQFYHEIDEAILASHSEVEIARAIVYRLPEVITDCIQASVIMYDFEQRTLTQLVKSGSNQTNINETFPFRNSEYWGPVHEELKTGKPYIVENLDELPEGSVSLKGLDCPGINTHIYYPIVIGDNLIGTLNLGMRSNSPVSIEQSEMISELLVVLSVGLEQTRLHERELEINRRLLETVINNIPVAVSLIRGSDFKIIFANPTYFSITPGKTLIGNTLNEIWNDTEYDYMKICQNILETDEPFMAEDDELILHRTPDSPAEKVFFSWWLFPIEIPNEEEKGILNMAYETTDRKLAEITLVEAERLTTIGRMAASLAHEINNPLQSVVGCIGLAMETMKSGEDATEFMDVAMEELIRTSQIVKRLRDMGRSEDVQKKPAQIENELEKVILLTKKQAEDQRIDIIFEKEEKLPEILAAADQLRQVFLNLILNAMEAMPDGGSLKISISRSHHPDGVQIRFTDTGIGIHQEQMDNMFTAFHTNKQTGLGLGLYISQRIILSHHGRIDVESEVGKGTTFTILLPSDG